MRTGDQNGGSVDDRTLRVAIIVIGHVMWLSTAALRILRGHRQRRITAGATWLLQYYTALVWIPLVFATIVFRDRVELADELQLAGVVIALAGSLFAAWAMWSLGRAYGIRLDVFEAAALKTDGPFAVVRHPMYLGILTYHVGAALALESAILLGVTALVVLPYTALRIAAEEQVLREGFGRAYADYEQRVPRILPLPR